MNTRRCKAKFGLQDLRVFSNLNNPIILWKLELVRVEPQGWHRDDAAVAMVTTALSPWPALSQKFHLLLTQEKTQMCQLSVVNCNTQSEVNVGHGVCGTFYH